MPLLLARIVAWFAALFAGFIGQRAKKVASVGAAVAVVSGAYVALQSALAAVLSGIAASVPGVVVVVLSWVVPDNLDDCLLARISVEIAVQIYKWARDTTMMAASA